MFTIFGATGNTGSVVARELLDRGKRVRVVGRDPAKLADLAARGAEVFRGDVTDETSIAAALDGAEGAYLLLPPANQSDDLLGRNRRVAESYAHAVAAKHVPHVVLLSSVGAQQLSGTGPILSAHVAEELLGAVGGTRFTFLRAAYFLENLLGYAGAMKGDGVVPVFGGGESVRFPMVATKDIGRTAANALLAPPARTEVIELSGPAEYSFDDAAEVASKLLGRPVKAKAIPIDALVPTFVGFGFSANVAGLYREMTEGLARGLVRFDGTGRAVRGSTTLEEVLRPALA